jgi:hypothetical protein
MTDAPEVSFSIDLRGLSAVLSVGEDGEPALTVGDDQNAVVLETGLGGSYEDAMRGCHRLHERSGQLLAVLRVRLGDRAPFTPLPPIDADGPVEWRQPDEPAGDGRLRP